MTCVVSINDYECSHSMALVLSRKDSMQGNVSDAETDDKAFWMVMIEAAYSRQLSINLPLQARGMSQCQALPKESNPPMPVRQASLQHVIVGAL